MISVYLDNCCYNRPYDDQEQFKTHLETEVFISTIKREKFDYTEWRKDKFDGKSLDDLLDEAAEYAKKYHID